MGLYVDGLWKDQWYDTGNSGGRFEREPTRFRGAVTAQGGAFPRAGRALSPVCLACLPVGASHHDLPQAQEA